MLAGHCGEALELAACMCPYSLHAFQVPLRLVLDIEAVACRAEHGAGSAGNAVLYSFFPFLAVVVPVQVGRPFKLLEVLYLPVFVCKRIIAGREKPAVRLNKFPAFLSLDFNNKPVSPVK